MDWVIKRIWGIVCVIKLKEGCVALVFRTVDLVAWWDRAVAGLARAMNEAGNGSTSRGIGYMSTVWPHVKCAALHVQLSRWSMLGRDTISLSLIHEGTSRLANRSHKPPSGEK